MIAKDVTCPNCQSAYDFQDTGIEYCEACHKPFQFRRIIQVTYTTEALSEKQIRGLNELRNSPAAVAASPRET